MTASELSHLRRELLARLADLYRSVRHDLSEATLSHAFEHDAEDESDAAAEDERAVIQGQLSGRDAGLSQAIGDALERIRAGTYGVCVDCDEPIPMARLRAVPWAERCAVDQSAADGSMPHPTL